jgi:UDP-glucose 4-epimerase
MHTVLVTGATGFIGPCLIQQLLAKNLTVRVLVRNREKIHWLPNDVDVFVGDLTQPESLQNVCKEVDTVFHLGGYAHAWSEKKHSFAQQHRLVNCQGTQNLLVEALRSRVKKFIFFSSVKAVADSSENIDETWHNPPTSAYGLAKRAAEQYILEAGQHTGMHVCILRPALVYGPKWKGNLESMLRATDRGLFPPIPPTQNQRSLVCIEDLCQAAMLAADNPNANGKIYFVTDGHAYSTRQLYVLMRKALGKKIPHWYIPFWIFRCLALLGDLGKKLSGMRLPFSSEALEKLFGNAQYNSTRIQRELGFKPIYNLEKMLPKIVEKYKATTQ